MPHYQVVVTFDAVDDIEAADYITDSLGNAPWAALFTGEIEHAILVETHTTDDKEAQ